MKRDVVAVHVLFHIANVVARDVTIYTRSAIALLVEGRKVAEGLAGTLLAYPTVIDAYLRNVAHA